MNPDPAFAPTESRGPSAPDATLFSQAWEGRSVDDLRAIIAHGLHDEGYAAAARELERRANLLAHQEEDVAEADRAHQRAFVRHLIIGFTFVAIAGIVIGLLSP